LEGAGIEEQIEPFAGGELAFCVLGFDAGFAAASQGFCPHGFKAGNGR
jgi:hypothetical protein